MALSTGAKTSADTPTPELLDADDLPHHSGSTPVSQVEAAVTVVSSFHTLATRNIRFNIAACIFVPLGLLSQIFKWGDIPTFVLNFGAIFSLSKMLIYCKEQLSLRVDRSLGGLLDVSFGNFVELIIGIFAVKQGQLRVVQASIIGSIICNLLLIFGMCSFYGGLFPGGRFGFHLNVYQEFDRAKASINAGLLAVVILGFMVPAVFEISAGESTNFSLKISRATAYILLITYIAFLVFHIKTNPDGQVFTRDQIQRMRNREEKNDELEDFEKAENEQEDEFPETVASIAFLGLVCATVIIGVCAEFLVNSLDGLSSQAGWTKTFIGVVALPLVGSAAKQEHSSTLVSAFKNDMDLVINVTVGASLQTALFVAPLLVLVGWMFDQPLSLVFTAFETVVLFATIFVMTTCISKGRTQWFQGSTLIASYVILATAFNFVE